VQKSATVAVINNEQKILLLRRGSTAPWMPGRYCLPGGKVEQNEDLINCAIRELCEETGIVIVDNNYLAPFTVQYSSGYSKTIFTITMNNPVVNLNWEHDNYVWANSSDIINLNIVPGLNTTIKSLAANALMM
jgi:8-oxo-dGTP pyrophosphatase MutT (NUDIX family)